MIPLEEALSITLRQAVPLDVVPVSLAEAAGRILREDVCSDLDMPPFDKSAVDGYACLRDDLGKELSQLEVIAAGTKPGSSVRPGTCSKIMTGAMVPRGADCVFMVEDSEEKTPGKIRFTGTETGSNICFRGEDIRNGDLVLRSGTLIRPQELAVLATAGKTNPVVSIRPRVAVITTGNELVPPSEKPSDASIRDSNSIQLTGQILRAGAIPANRGIVTDQPGSIRQELLTTLETNDIILFTGGVSMGDYDHVPGILESAGVDILFRKIAIQPGKPTVFGIKDGKPVFGLPGNPVSSFVLFEMLVRPLILAMMGWKGIPPVYRMRLGEDFKRRKSERKALIPVRIENGMIRSIRYHGSAHINAYTGADGIISMDMGVDLLIKGDYADVRPV